MLLNTVDNGFGIDLTERKYIDLEDSSMRIYSILQDEYVSIIFVVDAINASNFYSVSANTGLLIEMNLLDGKCYTKEFIACNNSNSIFKESQKDFTEYNSYRQFFDNNKLSSIFIIDSNVEDYEKTVYSMMSKNFVTLVFLNYFMNLNEEFSDYDIVEYINDLDFDETLLSYFRRKGLCDSTFNLYKSTLKPKYYNCKRTTFKRMYNDLLFSIESTTIIEREVHNYFRRKNDDLHSIRKLKVLNSLIPFNCRITSVVGRFEDIDRLYNFDAYLNNMDYSTRDKVLKFMRDFICGDINKLVELISYISDQFNFNDSTEDIDKFINYYYRLKGMYDADLYEYGKKDGVTSAVIKAGVPSEWLYYYGKAKSLNERFGSNITYQPKELISAHHQIADSFYYLPDRDAKLKLNELECYSKITDIFGESNHIVNITVNSALVLPKSRKDFIKEGLDLENFAHGYYDLVKKNKCMVLFLRNKDDMNKCVCTLEFDSRMTKLVHVSCKNDKPLCKDAMTYELTAITTFCRHNKIDCSILKSN